MHAALLDVVGLRPQAHTPQVVTGLLGLKGGAEEWFHQAGLANGSLPHTEDDEAEV